MGECSSTAPPKCSSSHGIAIAVHLPVFCTIIKLYGFHNLLKLNTTYQLHEYADNLKYLETVVVLKKNKESLIDATGEAGNK